MAKRQPQRQSLELERIGAAAGAVRRSEDMNDLLAARMQAFENSFRKRGLADKGDTQLTIPAPRLPNELYSFHQRRNHSRAEGAAVAEAEGALTHSSIHH